MIQLKSLTPWMLGSALFVSVGCSKTDFGLQDQNQAFDSVVTYNNQVDVLLVLDGSTSMNIHKEKLAQESAGIIDALNSSRMDYNIAVINTDMRTGGSGGRFLAAAGTPRVLNRATPGLKEILRDRIKAPATGNNTEQGLASIEAALKPSYLNGAGAGFFRPEALLAIISLSDEDDGSVSKDWVRALDTVKPRFKSGLRGWIVNYIGIIRQQGACVSSPSFASVGLKWMELAQVSGGLSESICEASLGVAASNIRSRIVQIRTDFPLDKLPKVETIAVFINGQPVPKSSTDGYTYFAEGNFIRFSGRFIPGPDAKLKVDYAPLGAG